jgi:hypothetical protein
MAFGDSSRAQNQIDYQTGTAQNYLNNLRKDTVVPQNQTMWNQYLTANDLGRQQQSDIMGGYKDVAGSAGSAFAPTYSGFSSLASGNAGAYDPQFRGGLGSALGGYQDFAQTGGFTPQGIQDLRARSIAPIRAVYANAMRDIDRQKSLQSGYAPNIIAAKAKMARGLGQSLADASTNVEAGLAEQIRSGRLAGLGGMNQVATSGQGLQNVIDSLGLQGRTAGLTGMSTTAGQGMDAILRALGGGANVYSAAPGIADMAGRNALTSSGQQINLAELQNQLGLGTTNAQINKGQIPGNVAQGIDAAGKVIRMIPGIGAATGAIAGPGGGGGGMDTGYRPWQ